MALQVVSPAVNVYKVLGVKDGQEVTEDHTFKRGEMLPDWVSPFQQFTLTSTGMARQVGDLIDPTLVEAANPPAPVIMPEHNPRAVLNSGVTEPRLVTETVDHNEEGIPAAAADLELPDDSATKPVWEKAAERVGMKPQEAESMRKADLVAEVKRRKAVAEERRDLGGPDAELPPARA